MNGKQFGSARSKLGYNQQGIGEAIGCHIDTIIRHEYSKDEVPKMMELALIAVSKKLPAKKATGNDIKNIMKEREWSAIQLAEKLGVERQCIYNYTRSGKKEIGKRKSKLIGLALAGLGEV